MAIKKEVEYVLRGWQQKTKKKRGKESVSFLAKLGWKGEEKRPNIRGEVSEKKKMREE